MIKSSELRIGNRLKPIRVLDPENIPLLGYMICAGHIAYSNEELNNDWEAIPLTLEILERCGFEQVDVVVEDGERTFWHHSALSDLKYSEGHRGVYVIQFGFEDIPYITFLHRLQNLYFALTGEELEIKL